MKTSFFVVKISIAIAHEGFYSLFNEVKILIRHAQAFSVLESLWVRLIFYLAVVSRDDLSD